MISSEERREMAEQLRKHNGHYYEELVNMSDSDLADLIDPTCKNKAEELNRMAPMEMRTDNLICSACGELFCADPDGVNHPIDWAYCPNCGARVVERGED